MNTCPQSSSQIGWARQNVPKVLAPHELVSLPFDESFHLVEPATETIEDRAHVSSFLHGNDARVIFFVDPDKEVLLIVVPNPARVRPVTRHSRARE